MPFFANPRAFEILGILFWIAMIYHCATREPNTPQKFLWLLLVICIPDIGALIYFFMRVVRIRG